MKLLYLDCASGISGDMLLGALLDLGLDIKWLRKRLAALPLSGYAIRSRAVERGHMGARKVDVKASGDHKHRGLKEISSLIRRSALEQDIKDSAMAVFRRIIQVEARLHRIPEQKVHLHEVGAVDAIVDIVGAVTMLRELLGADGRLHCSALNVGHGTVKMAHGLLPVPAPATSALLKGVPIYSAGPAGEMVTPTGAAIVTTMAASFGPPPPMIIEAVGYGAGSRDPEGHPNVLRATLGAAPPATAALEGEVTVIECTIDDMSPQLFGHLMDRLFEAGALEVFYTPVQMKKNRPGILVTVICPPDLLDELTRVIFSESTTIGLRYRTSGRREMARSTVTVRTPYGKVEIKVSSLNGKLMQAQPEFRDCRKLAQRRGVPLKEVQAAALSAFRGTPA